MPSQTLPRTPFGDASCSVMDFAGIRHVLMTYTPQPGGTLTEQLLDVVRKMDRVLLHHKAVGGLVHLTMFLAHPELLPRCRRWLRAHYAGEMPAISYIPQPPCNGALLAVEALAVEPHANDIQMERISEKLVVIRGQGLAWVFVAQAQPRTSSDGVYERTGCAYQHLLRMLPLAGARLDQVVRTWLYLGGIVEQNGSEQRYKALNRARAEVYEEVPFLAEHLPEGSRRPVFPASTGIGTQGLGLSVDALAVLSEREDVFTVPLENPRQTAAYDYSTVYSPRSPKFSRGLALVAGADATLYLSGTASITQSETQHIGDPVGQALETLENMRVLVSEDNLARHGLPGLGASLDELALLRVYVKNSEDYPAIREAVEQQIGPVPAVYTVADVCRPELLVEMEGMAFTHREGGPLPLRLCQVKTTGHPRIRCPGSCPDQAYCPFAVLD